MKKDTLIEIVLGTIGGLVFAIGMCMGLVKEWNMLVPGIIVGVIGFIILLAIIPIYRKNHPKVKSDKKIDWSLVLTFVIGIIGSLVMGFGMSQIMVGEPSQSDLIIGMITGIIGLLVCVLNYPVYSYIKSNK